MSMRRMPTIVSIQVGRAARYVDERTADRMSRTWTTAFFKTPVSGAALFSQLGVAGDEQADRQNHGGIDKAVLAYSADHYAYWRTELNLRDMPLGAFGENVSIAGLDETSVSIGDHWQAGDVVFEVSQPRQPCWKMGRRWQLADLPKRVIQNGKSGWYLRVVTGGELAAPLEMRLLTRPRPQWTVARASRLLYHEPDNLAGVTELANVPELSHAWREALLDRIAKYQPDT
jgi:MOSC domain-containing protein YiiM